MSWYVVLDGWNPGVYGDKRQAYKSIKGYYDGEDSKVYTYPTMEIALSKYNEFICNRMKLPPKAGRSLHMNSIRYELMPRYRGQISVIPESTNNYQFTVHINYTYRYIVFIMYNHCEVYFIVSNLPKDTNTIKQYLYGINVFSRYRPNSTLLISEQSIAMAFEHGWVYQWLTKGILVKDFNIWANTYNAVRNNRVYVKHHPKYLLTDQIIEVVQWEVFRQFYSVLEKRNPSAYERDYMDYYIDCNIPPTANLKVEHLSNLSTLTANQ